MSAHTGRGNGALEETRGMSALELELKKKTVLSFPPGPAVTGRDRGWTQRSYTEEEGRVSCWPEGSWDEDVWACLNVPHTRLAALLLVLT
jgi:hypothetical protein